MPVVHIYIADEESILEEDVYAYVNATYTEDGEQIDSHFMRDIGLTDHEPGCIELVIDPTPLPLPHLLEGCSYVDQWISQLPVDDCARVAVCVYEPNVVADPTNSKYRYVGGYGYRTQ